MSSLKIIYHTTIKLTTTCTDGEEYNVLPCSSSYRRGCFLIILVSDGKIDNLNGYKKRIYNILSVILNSGI